MLSCLSGVNYVRCLLSLNNLAVANNLFCIDIFSVAILAIAMANPALREASVRDRRADTLLELLSPPGNQSLCSS